MDTLLDVHGDTLNLERLAEIQLAAPSDDAVPLLGRVLEDLATGDILPGAHIAPFSALAADAASETASPLPFLAPRIIAGRGYQPDGS
jgi:hypothetical protein